MNGTFRVGSNFNCDSLPHQLLSNHDPTWRHIVLGCIFLRILQDMYKFNVVYVIPEVSTNLTLKDKVKLLPLHNDSIDIYVTPFTLRSELLDHADPIQAVFMWRFGFILQRIEGNSIYSRFYSKPFSRPAWNCLYGMAVLATMILYLLKWWEKRLMGSVFECSLAYEILMVIGAYCQHIPPLDAVSLSRRMGYLCFFFYAYIVYTYYTSNLLSHLVNDKDHSMELGSLADSDYKCFIVDYMKSMVEGIVLTYNKNISAIESKMLKLKSVDIITGLEAVRGGKSALLTDFVTLYPIIKQTLENEEICNLVEIDLYSNIKKYLFTSKTFPYKEQFKIGTLRIREVGIMLRHIKSQLYAPITCDTSARLQANIVQISIPLAVLGGTYIACLIILFAERMHHKRNKPWPYVN